MYWIHISRKIMRLITVNLKETLFLQLLVINYAIFQAIEWKQNHLLIFLKKRNYWRQGEDQPTW